MIVSSSDLIDELSLTFVVLDKPFILFIVFSELTAMTLLGNMLSTTDMESIMIDTIGK